ncbi:MAG: hypothetical protein QME96_13690, partial [Myxococcota bacterium]|nr:hypothetical protein [Myxococcota bacterium]
QTAAGAADCNGDGAADEAFGAKCSTGTAGYPDYGRLFCAADGTLTCRGPAAPGEVRWTYSMPNLRAVAKSEGKLLTLKGAKVDLYPLAADGKLGDGYSINLRRAGHDMAVASGALLVADGAGMSIYRLGDGAFLSSVETCGRARRIFVDRGWAYIVGLRSVLIVDVTDPTAPRVADRIRLSPLRDRLEVSSHSGSCSWLDRSIDALCDRSGACGGYGRAAAAYADGRLFLNMLGTLYVLDFADGAPVVAAALPVGLVTDMAVEGRFAYVNGPGRGTTLVAQRMDGTWALAGGHDVSAWVEGVVKVGRWTIRATPGRLEVATVQ